ncbi:hypothetical protein GGF46_004905 [Coemansia sp. RSA 552]|nr:hypothetical protein GGF46_004905 [Coemansia sp. RSA 552]
MRLAVVGGMGAVAQELVVQAMEAGNFVSWLVKPEDVLPDPALESDEYAQVLRVVRGQWDSEEKYSEALHTCDSVAVALDLHHTRAEQLVPTQKLVQKAMRRHDIKRIILVTTHGCGDSSRRLDWGFWAYLNIQQAFYMVLGTPSLCWSTVSQYTEQEKVLFAGALQYTVLRPAFVTGGPSTGTYLASPSHVFGGYISAADVADCALKALDHEMDVSQTFSVAYSSRVA